MKINLIHKKLSKSLLLATAISVISFSSVYATDFIAENGDQASFTNRTETSGNILVESNAEMAFSNSTLGNAEGGRFTMTMYGNRFDLSSTTLYVDNCTNFSAYAEYVFYSGKFYADNAVSNIAVLRMSGNSVFKAPSFAAKTIEMGGSSYLETRLNGGQLMMEDNAYWKSIGTSSVSNLSEYGNGTIELVMTSSSDALRINQFDNYGGSTDFQINFSNELIEEAIANLGGTFGFHMDNVIVISSATEGNINYIVNDSNGTYTWDVRDSGGGNFDVYNFTLVIPEPSTYAMIFGLLALGLAIYRRRK